MHPEPPPARPETVAWRLLIASGYREDQKQHTGRHRPASAVRTGAAGEAMAAPAAVRYILDFDTDGYLLRGSMEKNPGPFPGPPIAS